MAVEPLPGFSLSDSLLMTEPSSLGNLLQVTIATRGGELCGSRAPIQVMSSSASANSPLPLEPKSRHNGLLLKAFHRTKSIECSLEISVFRRIRELIRESFCPILLAPCMFSLIEPFFFTPLGDYVAVALLASAACPAPEQGWSGQTMASELRGGSEEQDIKAPRPRP